MSAIETATKRCILCGEEKPLSEFHRQTAASDGLQRSCKPCARARTKANQQEWRERLGEEEWLRKNRRIVDEHRRRTGNAKGKEYGAAQRLALRVLREHHRREYDHLLLLARRGELSEPERGQSTALQPEARGSRLRSA